MKTLAPLTRTRIVPLKFYSVRETSNVLGVIEEVIRRYLRSGILQGTKVRVRGFRVAWKVQGRHIHAYLRDATQPRPEAPFSGRKQLPDSLAAHASLTKLAEVLNRKHPVKLPKDWAKNIDKITYGSIYP